MSEVPLWVSPLERPVWDKHALPTSERRGTNLNASKDIRTENGSRQGQDLAVTALRVPSSLDRGQQESTNLPTVGLTGPESGLDCLMRSKFARQRSTGKDKSVNRGAGGGGGP